MKGKQIGGRAEQDGASQGWGVIMHRGVGDEHRQTQKHCSAPSLRATGLNARAVTRWVKETMEGLSVRDRRTNTDTTQERCWRRCGGAEALTFSAHAYYARSNPPYIQYRYITLHLSTHG